MVVDKGAEHDCRVCGLRQDESIWGADGRCPTYDICACCGCEFGYEDCDPAGVRRHRESWVASGHEWFLPAERPDGWRLEDQLANVPRFTFKILPGLPGTGEPAETFSPTAKRLHSEHFVVEFSGPSWPSWVGNFEAGTFGANAVFAHPTHRDLAVVIAEGLGYVVELETRTLVRSFGGQIADVFSLPDREAMIFGNGLWFECHGPEGLRWTTRRISWDGMTELALDGVRLRGQAYSPLGDTWSPFELDVDTGEVEGGSYPPDLP